jgi:HrpA-like RNA helicase
MDRVDETNINYDLIEDILRLILVNYDKECGLVPPENADLSHGAVLVFMPGKGEIITLTERLKGSRLFRKEQFEIVPLHSTLSSGAQRLAFMPARPGCRKIIISTNIAETSVTIPDVVCGTSVPASSFAFPSCMAHNDLTLGFRFLFVFRLPLPQFSTLVG